MGHRPKQATRCARCRLHEERCICAEVPLLACRTRIVVVMHYREHDKPTATAPLALLALPNHELHIHGTRDHRIDLGHLNDRERRTWVLYPSEEALPLTAELVQADPRPITLVVPDGTWRQGARLARRLPGLEGAQRVFLKSERPSQWGIRIEPKPFGLSTFEAIARALGIIEGSAIQSELEQMFSRVVAETLEARGPQRTEPIEAAPSGDAITILYQDESVLVVNKPSGMLVHRSMGTKEPTVMQIVRDQMGEWVYPVHRLDRATSGAVLLARSSRIAHELAQGFEQGQIEKHYLALCRGHDPELKVADSPLPRDLGGEPQPALTHFQLLGNAGRYGLYSVWPKTGRRHQIRMHLKQKSHPLIGDVRYGKGEHNRLFRETHGFHRLALHALGLSFRSPSSAERVSVLAPLPTDLRQLFQNLGLVACLPDGAVSA